ncbi:MAG TPA: DUF1707 domain-containing protein [Trebonia sp.]|nr:DUF1707 domain-containing protein [Trebonia sp.]
MAAGRPGRMVPSVADRERVTVILRESFIAGRLTGDELAERTEAASVAGDFRDLIALLADLPVRGPFDRLPAHRVTPRPPVHGWRSWQWLARVLARPHL